MTSSQGAPLVTVRAKNLDAGRCPFANEEIRFELRPGDCVRLAGVSGSGKSTLATYVAGLSNASKLRKNLGIDIDCRWDPTVPEGERCGALFQSTTLLDSLTIAGNVAVALNAAAGHLKRSNENVNEGRGATSSKGSSSLTANGAVGLEAEIKRLVEAVGLNYARDASKRPSELSGGMARRASLALQLAQRKRVVVLDEPFTGLDSTAAAAVAEELQRLRHNHGTALLLISHEPDIVALLMGSHPSGADRDASLNSTKVHDNDYSSNSHTSHGSQSMSVSINGTDLNRSSILGLQHQRNSVVTLRPALARDNPTGGACAKRSLLAGTTFTQRFGSKVADYCFWSLPLVLLALAACGLAVSLLTADLLQRLDVTEPVVKLVDQEVRPLLQMVNKGEAPNPLMLMLVKSKVRAMLNDSVPKAKAALYGQGLAKLFVLEVGPLLTALLLCGRIGGAYAGEVAMMQASHQAKLLRTLGISPIWWTLGPSLVAVLVAGPALTIVATTTAVALGAVPLMGASTDDSSTPPSSSSGPSISGGLDLGTTAKYFDHVQLAVFPPWKRVDPSTWQHTLEAGLGAGVQLLASRFLGLLEKSQGLSSGSSSSSGDIIGSSGGSEFIASQGELQHLPSGDLDGSTVAAPADEDAHAAAEAAWSALWDASIEVATYPPVFLVLKATTYGVLVLLTAEVAARRHPDLTPRGVPYVITTAVVAASLLVIVADWGFSQLLLQRTW